MKNCGKFLCKYCGDPLEWEDILDTEGGIEDKWYLERQLWTCKRCDVGYVIGLSVDITNPKVEYFEES